LSVGLDGVAWPVATAAGIFFLGFEKMLSGSDKSCPVEGAFQKHLLHMASSDTDIKNIAETSHTQVDCDRKCPTKQQLNSARILT
jgi:hypothetical protein